MDLQEWEILSDEGYIDLHEDHGSNKIITPKSPPHTTIIDMNYFQKFEEINNKKARVIPVPIKFDHEEELPEEVTKLPISSSSDHMMKKDENFGDEQEMISKVFFKKLKENEFVDMKMDSPKSQNRGILPQVDVGTYQFEEEAVKDGKFEKETEEKDEKFVENEEKNGGMNIWKMAMSGMGALVSFGFAAATVSLIVFSNRHKESKQSKQELHFQIYSHDKRFKQMVQRATKLNEAISVMRGAPITRAHITIGGYYEGL